MVVVVKWSACFDDPSSNPVKAYSFYSVHCLKRTKIDKKKLWTANLKRNRQRSDLEWHRQIYKLDWTKEREKERHGKQHKASIQYLLMSIRCRGGLLLFVQCIHSMHIFDRMDISLRGLDKRKLSDHSQDKKREREANFSSLDKSTESTSG